MCTHYLINRSERRRKLFSMADFHDASLCGNGDAHATRTRNPDQVTCAPCAAILASKPHYLECPTMTLQEYAAAYVATINGRPANGWGQHVHATLGRSDFIMGRMRVNFGDAETNAAIDAAFAAAREARAS